MSKIEVLRGPELPCMFTVKVRCSPHGFLSGFPGDCWLDFFPKKILETLEVEQCF